MPTLSVLALVRTRAEEGRGETVNKFLARTFLLVCQIAIMFANYWYTFGLWPKSWTSFVLCGIASIMLIALGILIEKEKV